MIRARLALPTRDTGSQRPIIGTGGRLAVLAWSFAMVLAVPPSRIPTAAGVAIVVNIAFYPSAVRQLLRWRWPFFASLLILPSMFLVGETDQLLFGIPISSTGLQAGLNMLLRALVVILAVDGFSSAVDIAEVAGLLERVGLPGLGFSIGVAVNLLPALRKSSQNVWRSLRMRGGLRRQWWRGLQYLLVTVVVNALRRAEEIALAAEVRAFHPEQARALPLKIGPFDYYIVFVLLLSWLLLVFVL